MRKNPSEIAIKKFNSLTGLPGGCPVVVLRIIETLERFGMEWISEITEFQVLCHGIE